MADSTRERLLRAELEEYKDLYSGVLLLAGASIVVSLVPALLLMYRHFLLARELTELRAMQPVHARLLSEPGALLATAPSGATREAFVAFMREWATNLASTTAA